MLGAMERPRPTVVGTPRVTVAWWPAAADHRAVHGWLLLLFAVALMAKAVPAGSAPSLALAAGLGTWALGRCGSQAGLMLGGQDGDQRLAAQAYRQRQRRRSS